MAMVVYENLLSHSSNHKHASSMDGLIDWILKKFT